MKPLIFILDTDNEANLIDEIMGHRQDMTLEQRLEWDYNNYKKRLESNMGSNYEYWNWRHDDMLGSGWDVVNFRDLDQGFEAYTRYETKAKEKVIELRAKGNFARIVCVANKLRVKTYSVIFKPKK
jgi:hypothetical protein